MKVGEIVLPADFYVLNMGKTQKQPTLILGRPFMKTAHMKIDCDMGTLSYEFNGMTKTFNVFKGTKHPQNNGELAILDHTDQVEEETLPMITIEDPLQKVIWKVWRKDAESTYQDKQATKLHRIEEESPPQ